jgi:hypothetical protein
MNSKDYNKNYETPSSEGVVWAIEHISSVIPVLFYEDQRKSN